MTKFLTTLLILSGIYSMSLAQSKTNVELGVNVGYNAAYISQTGYSDVFSPAIGGFNVGVSADFPTSPTWSIKVKAIYDQKGWADGFITDNQGNTINDVNFRLDYITIPVMANWHFGRSKNWYLNFGGYAGFLLDASETSSGMNVKDAFNPTDFGIALGIGVKIPISKNAKFFIEDDGQAGLINIFKNSDGDVVQNVRSSINVGIAFNLK
jgi:hypothetical protein